MPPRPRQEATARAETDVKAVVQCPHSQRIMARLNKRALAMAKARTGLPRWVVMAARGGTGSRGLRSEEEQ